MKFKWQQRGSNPQPLSSQTNTQPFSQTSLMVELCCEYLSVQCIWLCYYVIMYFIKWSSVRLRTKCLWVQIPLLSLKLQRWRLLRARSSLAFRQTIECRFTLKLVFDMLITYRLFMKFDFCVSISLFDIVHSFTLDFFTHSFFLIVMWATHLKRIWSCAEPEFRL